MSYLSRTLEPGERVERLGRLHWIIFARPIVALGIGIWVVAAAEPGAWTVAGFLLAIAALLRLLAALIKFWTTEIAVTDRRVLLKVGLIRRDTIEINAAKVESVDVSQPLLGRLLNYGTVQVRGTGGHANRLADVADPLALRRAVARV